MFSDSIFKWKLFWSCGRGETPRSTLPQPAPIERVPSGLGSERSQYTQTGGVSSLSSKTSQSRLLRVGSKAGDLRWARQFSEWEPWRQQLSIFRGITPYRPTRSCIRIRTGCIRGRPTEKCRKWCTTNTCKGSQRPTRDTRWAWRTTSGCPRPTPTGPAAPTSDSRTTKPACRRPGRTWAVASTTDLTWCTSRRRVATMARGRPPRPTTCPRCPQHPTATSLWCTHSLDTQTLTPCWVPSPALCTTACGTRSTTTRGATIIRWSRPSRRSATTRTTRTRTRPAPTTWSSSPNSSSSVGSNWALRRRTWAWPWARFTETSFLKPQSAGLRRCSSASRTCANLSRC